MALPVCWAVWKGNYRSALQVSENLLAVTPAAALSQAGVDKKGSDADDGDDPDDSQGVEIEHERPLSMSLIS
jgi:hypothetical protein